MSIGNCTCSHSGQDAIHGKGRRVINPKGGKAAAQGKETKGKGEARKGRCTVCGVEHEIRAGTGS